MTYDPSRDTLQKLLEGGGAVFKAKKCRCIFCDDHKASGELYEKDGHWRYKCFGKCGFCGDAADVRDKLNGGAKSAPMTLKAKREDLPKTGRSWPTIEGAIEAARAGVANNEKIPLADAVYADTKMFHTEQREEHAAEIRFNLPTPAGAKQEKTIRPVHRVSGGWAVGDPSGLWLPYRVCELKGHARVYLTEGAKAADAAVSVGLVATTSAHGADSPHKTDWRALVRAGVKEVRILPDNDEKGEDYKTKMIGILAELGIAVRVVYLPDLPPKGDIADFCDDLREGQEAEAIRAEVEALADAAEVVKTEDAFGVEVLDAAALVKDFPELRPVVVGDVARRGEVCNLIAAPKVGKSWAVLNLAVAVAVGGTWFGHQCVQGRILLIDNELHKNTLASRIRQTASMWGMSAEDLRGLVDVAPMRGHAKDLIAMGPWLRSLEPGRYNVIVFDAMYRALPKDIDDNSNVAMTTVYNLLDDYAAATDAALVMVHHASKGDQSGKGVTDVGSGAGAMSRAADSHLILRAHREPGAVVLDVVNRSFPPCLPSVWRLNVPLFTPEPTLDPTLLATTRKPKEPKPAVAEKPPKAEPWTTTRFAAKYITKEPKTLARLQGEAEADGLSAAKVKRFAESAAGTNLAHKWPGGAKCPTRYATIPQPVTEVS